MQPSSSQSSSHNHPYPKHSPIRSTLSLKRSDLGSDDEWQLTMASDSDLDEPEQSPPNPPSSSSQNPDPPADNLNRRVQWHNSNEEKYIDDIKQPIIPPLHNPLLQDRPATDPPRLDSCDYSTNLAAHFNSSVDLSNSSQQQQSPSSLYPPPSHQHHPEPTPDHQQDHYPDDQLVLIPGYRGSSSRDAVAKQPALSPNPPESQPSSSTPSSRANPVPLTSAHPCTDLSSTQTHISDQPQPSQSPTTTSTDKKQDSNSASLHPTKHIQSVDQSASSPSTDLHQKPTDKPSVQQQPTSVSTTTTSTSIPTATTSDSGRNHSRRTSGIRATLRDSTARLTAARLSASYRQSQAHSLATDLTIHGNQNPNNNLYYTQDPSRNLFVPLRQSPSPQYQIEAAAAPRNPGYHFLNSGQEDDSNRRESDLAQASVHLGRPSNPPLYAASADFVTPGASSSNVPPDAPDTMFPSSSVEPSHLPTHAGRARFKPVTKSTRDLSFLECIVEILKGCSISRRRYLLGTIEGEIWLTSDMKTVQYRMAKKGQPPAVQSITLDQIRMVRGSERELTIEVIDRKKPLQFIFRTQARAETWLSALSCIVPSHTTVKLRHRKLEMRETYDPVRDTWNGKPVAAKKQLNEFIILGTIGKGSFGKVKLALSRQDRKFYALKVIHKTQMLKKMRTFLQQRGPEGGGTQLTIVDVNEIYVMKDLEHENVIRFKGVFDATMEDRLYIALEFLPRGPIMRSSELLSEHRMSEDKARLAFVDVLSGLQYLHSRNIVHCDIKPDNLLQAGDGTVKISDFGAAIRYSGESTNQDAEEEQYRQTMGTPAFSAPEHCLYEHSPPRPARRYAADIWSLGATLYYMVFGQVPFPAPHMFQIFAVICTEPLTFPKTPAVSKNLRSLLEQMMQKSPEERATIESIVESRWLTESVEVAERLAKIRSALSGQSNGTSTERRQGLSLQPDASVPPR